MARESARRRAERRFGRPERLADRIMASTGEEWEPPKSFRYADDEHRRNYAGTIGRVLASLPFMPVVEASNVAAYTYRNCFDAGKFTWDSLVIRPPFENVFIEASAPDVIATDSGVAPWPGYMPRRFGFWVQHGSAETFIDLWRERIGRTGFKVAGAETAVVMIPFWEVPARGRNVLGFPGCSVHYLIDGAGRPTDASIVSIDNWHSAGGTAEMYKLLVQFLSFAAINAIMFMNCTNVTVDPVDPDPAVNRERKRAGLAPFLRYHTINIEPMKRALRTEGDIEANGLKKALHICRGHFARYTDSFMGRPLEKPLTVWRPAHVRGSAEKGVVVSDYTVSPGK